MVDTTLVALVLLSLLMCLLSSINALSMWMTTRNAEKARQNFEMNIDKNVKVKAAHGCRFHYKNGDWHMEWHPSDFSKN